MLYKILYVEKALKLITKIENSSKYRQFRFAGYTQYRKEVQTTAGGKAPAEVLWQAWDGRGGHTLDQLAGAWLLMAMRWQNFLILTQNHREAPEVGMPSVLAADAGAKAPLLSQSYQGSSCSCSTTGSLKGPAAAGLAVSRCTTSQGYYSEFWRCLFSRWQPLIPIRFWKEEKLCLCKARLPQAMPCGTGSSNPAAPGQWHQMKCLSRQKFPPPLRVIKGCT